MGRKKLTARQIKERDFIREYKKTIKDSKGRGTTWLKSKDTQKKVEKLLGISIAEQNDLIKMQVEKNQMFNTMRTENRQINQMKITPEAKQLIRDDVFGSRDLLKKSQPLKQIKRQAFNDVMKLLEGVEGRGGIFGKSLKQSTNTKEYLELVKKIEEYIMKEKDGLVKANSFLENIDEFIKFVYDELGLNPNSFKSNNPVTTKLFIIELEKLFISGLPKT